MPLIHYIHCGVFPWTIYTFHECQNDNWRHELNHSRHTQNTSGEIPVPGCPLCWPQMIWPAWGERFSCWGMHQITRGYSCHILKRCCKPRFLYIQSFYVKANWSSRFLWVHGLTWCCQCRTSGKAPPLHGEGTVFLGRRDFRWCGKFPNPTPDPRVPLMCRDILWGDTPKLNGNDRHFHVPKEIVTTEIVSMSWCYPISILRSKQTLHGALQVPKLWKPHHALTK